MGKPRKPVISSKYQSIVDAPALNICQFEVYPSEKASTEAEGIQELLVPEGNLFRAGKFEGRVVGWLTVAYSDGPEGGKTNVRQLGHESNRPIEPREELRAESLK
jgi:hypothetical protein